MLASYQIYLEIIIPIYLSEKNLSLFQSPYVKSFDHLPFRALGAARRALPANQTHEAKQTENLYDHIEYFSVNDERI